MNEYEKQTLQWASDFVTAFGDAELSSKWDALQRAQRQFQEAALLRDAASQTYADALARIKGVQAGTRIIVHKQAGYGSYRWERPGRYEVTRWARGLSADSLKIWAKAIKKDGTLGVEHEIWRSWEIEK